ncbi:MAG: TIGR01548 family HAD-type hydrolase [Oscillatoriales cyanobacterium SM2_2_1]|nr:TIGR01548 family HAD-type hydrolase [Oscillatoriales cyanobacterium SM2_2_1]
MVVRSHTAFIFDIDGVIRDVSGSYRRALADTVAEFAGDRPSAEEIDCLKAEGLWNNDWDASCELIRRRGLVPDRERVVDFFQQRYRGNGFNGYIAGEPLLATPEYFAGLTAAGVRWGFFSGATRASALFVLNRLAVNGAVLVAMEDAPGKPEPAGLWQAVDGLTGQGRPIRQVIYVGDTVADMLTVGRAQTSDREQRFIGIGVIPPHVPLERRQTYTQQLRNAGAIQVVNSVLEVSIALLDSIPD